MSCSFTTKGRSFLFGFGGVNMLEALCLFMVIYFEARGEPFAGKVAVAEVVMNRVANSNWPNSVCEVVTQKHQFSFYWDGRPEHISFDDMRVLRQIERVVNMAMNDALPGVTEGALYYHHVNVAPYWSKDLERTVVIGDHVFLR